MNFIPAHLSKRVLSAFMSVLMLVSVMNFSVFAADKEETIALSLVFRDESSDEYADDAVIAAGDEFEAAVDFAGNPTDADNTISSIAVFVDYINDKVAVTDAEDKYYEELLSGTQFNPERGPAKDIVYFNWYSLDGISVTTGSGKNKKTEIQEEGTLVVLLFKAKVQMSLSELKQSVGIIKGVEESDGSYYTTFTDKAGNKFQLSGVVDALGGGGGFIPPTYAVTVENGTLTNATKTNYAANETVGIKADTPAEGKKFDKWTGDGVTFEDATKAETTFTMPGNAVTVTANYVPDTDEPQTYAVTVEKGKAEKQEYAEGETVKITADSITDKTFVKWESSDGVTFDDATEAETSFTMPGNAVTVTATYKDVPSTPKYTVTEKNTIDENEYAESEYAEDETVTISADEKTGYTFVKWTSDDVIFERNSDIETTFTMPGKDVIVTANYIEDDGKHTVEVINGTITSSTELRFAPDETISIQADPAVGNRKFIRWESTDGVTFADPTNPETTFKMVDKNVMVSASYSGCYVATSVYGSYDCPEVWTLRRFRDDTLGETWYGRLFIKAYYAVSPTAVKLFGGSDWFQNFFRTRLDKMVGDLQDQGVSDTPYVDKNWN